MKLLISIPVHEAVDCIDDQLSNYERFAPNSDVFYHVSLSSGVNFKEQVASLYPRHRNFKFSANIETGDHTVWNAHYWAGLQHFLANKQYTHLAFEASNCLFVRPGVEGYIERNNNGVFLGSIAGSEWTHEHTALNDPTLSLQKNLRLSQIEGTFFSRETIEKMNYPIPPYVGYPQDECWSATMYPYEQAARPFCFVGWQYPNYTPSAEIVREIAAGKFEGCYSVKRVPRQMDHWLRKMVKTL